MSNKWALRGLALMCLVVFGSQAIHELHEEGLTWLFWLMAGSGLLNPVALWLLGDRSDSAR